MLGMEFFDLGQFSHWALHRVCVLRLRFRQGCDIE